MGEIKAFMLVHVMASGGCTFSDETTLYDQRAEGEV
jgi:hypothetical protein